MEHYDCYNQIMLPLCRGYRVDQYVTMDTDSITLRHKEVFILR